MSVIGTVEKLQSPTESAKSPTVSVKVDYPKCNPIDKLQLNVSDEVEKARNLSSQLERLGKKKQAEFVFQLTDRDTRTKTHVGKLLRLGRELPEKCLEYPLSEPASSSSAPANVKPPANAAIPDPAPRQAQAPVPGPAFQPAQAPVPGPAPNTQPPNPQPIPQILLAQTDLETLPQEQRQNLIQQLLTEGLASPEMQRSCQNVSPDELARYVQEEWRQAQQSIPPGADDATFKQKLFELVQIRLTPTMPAGQYFDTSLRVVVNIGTQEDLQTALQQLCDTYLHSRLLDRTSSEITKKDQENLMNFTWNMLLKYQADNPSFTQEWLNNSYQTLGGNAYRYIQSQKPRIANPGMAPPAPNNA